MAVEDAHKISFLAGWLAMLEVVERIGDERGTGKPGDTRDRGRYGANIDRGSGRSGLIVAVTGGRHPSTETHSAAEGNFSWGE